MQRLELQRGRYLVHVRYLPSLETGNGNYRVRRLKGSSPFRPRQTYSLEMMSGEGAGKMEQWVQFTLLSIIAIQCFDTLVPCRAGGLLDLGVVLLLHVSCVCAAVHVAQQEQRSRTGERGL